jgi:hypothetical protein
MKKNKICQSCGFPLKKDRLGGGTELDGSSSEKYCSMCYKNGYFLTPEAVNTGRKMQRYCMYEMKQAGMNSVFAWLATRSIPKLERWRER